ncbi:MAG TPA: tetraacyldisaccharide 4'-kinase, partial [Burkholderiaceae bacterium]
DEPALIHRATAAPVFIASKRAEAALALLARHPDTDVIVADDGLQHYALARDIEICVFDDRGAGNGFLLPAGPLREPWPRPPTNVPMLVLHSGERPVFAGFTARRTLAHSATRADGTTLPLDTLRGQPVQAVAGIAQPAAFFHMLEAQGLNLVHTVALADHACFDDGWTPPGGPGMPLLCTEKDAAKLWRSQPEAWAVALQCIPEPAFLAALDTLLDASLSSPTFASGSTHGQQTS